MARIPTRWDLEVDLVAVGSGLGALTAAMAAHDAGLRVAILEKADKLGGVCAYSGGEVFVPCNHLMAAAGLPDSAEAGLAYLRFLAGGYADEALQRVLFETAPEVIRYTAERGPIPWKIIQGFPDYHHPHAPGTAAAGRYLEVELYDGQRLGDWRKRTWSSPHMPPGITHDELFAWGSIASLLTWDFRLMGQRVREDKRGFGPGMMGWFVEATVLTRGIPAHVETPARELVVDDGGRVVGVRAEKDGKDWWVRARRGVVLAIGGYEWNKALATSFEALPDWNSAVQPTVEGDNVVLGGEVGAALAGVPPYNLGMFFGFQIPGEQHAGRPLWRASWEGGYPHALWVNRAGERFCDESFYRDYLPRLHAWDGTRQEHPNLPPFLVFDAQFRAKYGFGPYVPGQPIPEALVAQADTPRGLAEKLGVDPEGLERTLARFNGFADGATDPDFGRGRYPWANMMIGDRSRPNPNIGPVSKPPFYGLPLHPVGVGINAVGLRCDEHARVMHVRGRPVEGLYACGNSAAPLDTGAGYQSGLSNLRGLVWGYRAARHAAGVA